MRIALLTGLVLVLGACGGTQDSSGAHTVPDVIAPSPTPVTPLPGTPDPVTPAPGPVKPAPGPVTPTPGPVPSEPEVELPVPPNASPTAPQWPELQKTISTYVLTLSQSDYDALWAHIPDPPSKDFSVMGKFESGGHTYTTELSFRGRSTKTDPRIVKKSWDVRFDKNDRFQGKKNIELLAEWKDSGYLTEKLWYDLAASLGLRVPYARYAHVELHLVQPDGSIVTKYEGVFTELESINKDFLKAHGFDSEGDLYRCGMHDCEMRQPPQEKYQEPWDKKTNEDQPWKLWSFLEDLNRAPSHLFRTVAEREVELEDYLTWMTVETFIANDLQGDSRSYLVYDGKKDKWTYVPWDLNNALSLYNRTNAVVQGVKRSHALFSFTPYDPNVYDLADFRRTFPGMEDMKVGFSTLSTRIYDDPVLRARYVARLHTLLDTWFTEENIGPRVDAMHVLLKPYILPGADGKTADPYVSTPHAARSVEYLRRFVRERRAWLLQHLAEVEALGNGGLVIDRVGRDDSGAYWVQLYNRGATPLFLGNLYLSGFIRTPLQWALPATTLEAGQTVTFTQGAPGPDALGVTLDPARPELSLYAADGRTALDLMWLAPLQPGESYGRQTRGAELFGVQSGRE